ncbi:MAG: hypothetical protein M1365_07510 [Actinobacteria bacterium]|nr:hypothetical protein [Actinomycetota bacterium]
MRKFGTILIFLSVIFLITIAVYTSNAANSEKQKAAAESIETIAATTSLTEVTTANTTTTTAETLSTPNTTTVTETIETTEDTSKNLPTLKLIIYEGPVIINNDMCYYRVEAKVTGDPYPAIKFSKDDSNGTWGKNRAQVNLKNGESYDLVVTAFNSAGKVSRHIVLTWSQ